MLEDFRRAKEVVEGILRGNERSRSDDKELILEVMKHYGIRLSQVDEVKFREVMPSLESITRGRRDLQKKYPELRATDKVRAGRAVEEERMKSEIVSPNRPQFGNPDWIRARDKK